MATNDSTTRAKKAADTTLATNPILAFISATRPEGGCSCGNESGNRGAALAAMMAARLVDEDSVDLPLSDRDAIAVLGWLCGRGAREGAEFRFGGTLPTESKEGPDAGFGLYLIIRHVETCLLRADLERRAAAVGYKLIDEPDDGGVTVERIGDPRGNGLVGGNVEEVDTFLSGLEHNARAS